MKFFLSVFLVFIFLTGCSSNEVTTVKNPKGVVCFDDGICDVKDAFEANIDNIRKCLNSSMPLILKNYEGEAIFVKTEKNDFDMSKNYEKLEFVISLYFNELMIVYQELFNDLILKEIKDVPMYKESIYKKPENYFKRLFTNVPLSKIAVNRFAPTQVSEGQIRGTVECQYYNLSAVIMDKYVPFMPKSFELNMKSILAETSKRTMKRIAENKPTLELKNFKKAKIDFEFQQEFDEDPSIEQKNKVKEDFLAGKKKETIDFCWKEFSITEKNIECNQPELEKLTPFDIYELSQVTSLEYLDLVGTSVNSVKLLALLKQLKLLRITAENLKNPEDIDFLKTENPNLLILSVDKANQQTALTKYGKLKYFFESLSALSIENEEQTNWIQLFEAKNWDELIKIFTEKDLFLLAKAVKFNKTIYPEFDKYLENKEVSDIEQLYEIANLINLKFIEIHRDYLNSVKFKIDFNKVKSQIDSEKYENICSIIDNLKQIDAKNKELADLIKKLSTNANKLFNENLILERKEYLRAYENYKTVLKMCPDKTLLNKVNQKMKALNTKYKIE